MAIDWSLNRVPDFANAALTGYTQGREQGRERVRNAALAQYAQDPNAGIQALLPVDPTLAIGLQRDQRQEEAQAQTLRRQTETDTRERLARQQAATGQIFVSLRNVAEADRQAALVQMIQSRPDVWSPEEAQRAAAAFSQNKLDLSDARLDSLAQSRGVNPHEGDFTIGTGRYRAGATTPYARSQDPVITPFGIIPGAPATAPALSQEQIDKGMTAPPVAPATAAPGIAAAPAPGGAPSPGVAAAPGPASGGTATPPPPSSPPIALQDARGVVTSLGGHVTSGFRTPEENRRVRGVPNSYHIRGEGQAVDVRPIPGMTFQQFRQHLIDRGLPITELINEGDHWHWAFGQRGGNRRGGTAPVAPVNQTAPPSAPPPEGMDIGGGRRLIPMETPAQRLAAQEAARRARVDDARLGNDNRRLQLAEEEAARQGRPLTPQEQQQFPGAAYMNPNGTPGYPPAGAAGGRRPPNGTAQNLMNAAADNVRVAGINTSQIGRYRQMITGGQLRLGAASNIVGGIRNTVGASDANSRNMASFNADLARLRNDSLRLNRGTQTEGDAQRAWDELIANRNDQGIVSQRLAEIEALNRQAEQFWRDRYAQIREDNGLPPADPVRRSRPASAGGSASGFVGATAGGGRSTPPAAAARPPARPQASTRPPPRPQVGTTRNGYRYTGGDPASPSSWQRVR